MARPSESNPNGEQSKPKQTPEVLGKLEQAFAIGCTNREACIYADISESTFYRWLEEDDKLQEKFDRLKEQPVLKAKQRVVKGIDESYANAMDFLKRKKRAEFGDTIKLEHTKEAEKIANEIFDEDNELG